MDQYYYKLLPKIDNAFKQIDFHNSHISEILNFNMPERLVDDCELRALAVEDPIER